MESLFVELVDARDRGPALINVFGAGRVSLDVFASIFGAADRALHRSGAQLLVVVPKILDAVLDKSHRVVLIVDGEPTGVAFIQLLDVLTQDAHAEAVKCRNERRAGKFL